MTRLASVVASFAVLSLGAIAYARAHAIEEPLDPAKGASLTSRFQCDGSTNPRDEISLAATFSAAGWERSFRINEFDEKYCKRMNLEFVCLMPGKTSRWRPEWSKDSAHPSERGKVELDTCYKHFSKEAPKYLLTGWYKEGGPDPKLPWKQVAVKQVSSKPEVYEFTDPQGGTARVEISRR